MTEQQLNAPPPAKPPIPASGIRHINRRHPDRFTVVGNHLTQHRELSLTAIGLAAHIQSLPAGAKVTIKCLADRFPEGEVRIAAALRELEAHGYLARTRERLPSGQVITRTVSYNNPPAMTASPPIPPPAPTAAQPAPITPSPEAHRAAAELLTDLRRHDPRLLLSARDVRNLAPATTAWLDRGIPPEAVSRTLTAGLPTAPIHHPAALLAHRLTELLPPPLPATPRPARPDPLQNCESCDRAFRSPEPGHCRDCTPSASRSPAMAA
ncbi:helix-turn-helix domain-containing protein [Streptomyces kanamyceticus]|uniref:Helix-turn-helix domain-containing protein n=2 Tax=Streptomyces kanamyceticus TaxID=1967 RepID=A0A5J6GEV3_STRKN|nr:helix-turn-helix domain-containing protein [Streptomyces kanamyceticus]QEU94079.1 helix-turn-helix domain-containing protein [Streptomyces kanamyceticus]